MAGTSVHASNRLLSGLKQAGQNIFEKQLISEQAELSELGGNSMAFSYKGQQISEANFKVFI